MVGLGNIDDVYKHYLKVIDENKRLEKKLDIAVKALITYKNLRYDGTVTGYEYIAKEALEKIKEIK